VEEELAEVEEADEEEEIDESVEVVSGDEVVVVEGLRISWIFPERRGVAEGEMREVTKEDSIEELEDVVGDMSEGGAGEW
jgi:hypothetical protein